MKDIHLTLPDLTAEKVDCLAREFHETRNRLIRRALEEFFESERKRKLAEEMRRYAQKMAKKSGEFVKEFEPSVVKKLLKETKW
ncbi:MAG: hypothetical protein HY717_23995 [Planctomycetes bacterium]|nr:hypothetical protein [Planctomycetota bacterium]